MSNQWELAKREDISGFWVNGMVVLVARGKKPTPCHVVDIDQRPERIIPPMFSLRWQQSGLCAQVETPYEYAEAFFVGPAPASISVHHADGVDDVRIRHVDPNSFTKMFANVSASARASAQPVPQMPTTMMLGEEGPGPWTPWIQPEDLTTLAFPKEEQPTTHWFPTEEHLTTLRLGEEGPPTGPGMEDPFGGGGGGNPWGNW